MPAQWQRVAAGELTASHDAQALFMFPILMLGCIFVALCLAILGVRYTVRNLRRVWLRCDFAFSTFLLGQHAPAVAQHGHEHQHGFIEV